MNSGSIVVAIIAAFIIVAILVTSIKVVKQTEKFVIERLGKFHTILDPGLHFVTPFIDRVAFRVVMKEQIRDFAPQPVITKDNVTMQIDTVVFFRITDPKLYAYGVVDPITAIENLSSTTLRNIIGELDLDETLTSRDIINTKMRAILDEATDPWGIKVSRVEVKNILPPKDIREAMERQMRAEREKREQILLAEGEKKAQILKAEGEKESQILKAEAEKESQILKAEGEKESKIKIAEGQAKGILAIREAEAKGLSLIKDAKLTEEVLKIKSYETLEKVADGQSTKLIIPSNIQDITTLASVVQETVKKTK